MSVVKIWHYLMHGKYFQWDRVPLEMGNQSLLISDQGHSGSVFSQCRSQNENNFKVSTSFSGCIV